MYIEWQNGVGGYLYSRLDKYKFLVLSKKGKFVAKITEDEVSIYKQVFDTKHLAKKGAEAFFLEYVTTARAERKAVVERHLPVMNQVPSPPKQKVFRSTRGRKKVEKIKANKKGRIKPIMDKGVQEAAAMLGAICSRGKK